MAGIQILMQVLLLQCPSHLPSLISIIIGAEVAPATDKKTHKKQTRKKRRTNGAETQTQQTLRKSKKYNNAKKTDNTTEQNIQQQIIIRCNNKQTETHRNTKTDSIGLF